MTLTLQPQLTPGSTLHGFTLTQADAVPSIRSVVYQFQHQRTGARVLHIANDDAENLFSISFATPPTDDTGLPHILEHAVLSGSKQFPVRDPFFEMVKMSMATFINAMTGWDTTYYPVCSNVRKDLFNLAQVYFDAVFHPLLTEETFRREGHHLRPADPDQPTGKLAVSGIVFNEMKGYFSSPESRLYRLMSRALLPDTVYHYESGGDPVAIPDLTYEDLRQFHQQHYHPSNSYIILYGDIPTALYLQFLESRLASFEPSRDHSALTPQARWLTAKQQIETYPIGADEAMTQKTFITLSWLVGDATDPLQTVGWNILALILLGNEGAPLKKAIIDSKLGTDLIHSGDSDAGREQLFMVGIKGSEADRQQSFTDLVMNTLRDIAAQPIDPNRIDAAFQQASYHYLEIQSSYPLHMLYRVIGGWRYGKTPLTFLPMSEHLTELRRKVQAEPRYFNHLIQTQLIDNPHRLTTVLQPDPQWQKKWDDAFAQRLDKVRANLSDAQCNAIAAEAQALDERSGVPNSSQAVASLPQLMVRDLPAKPRHIPTQVDTLASGVTLLRNEVFANGVNYLHLDWRLNDLSPELWPMVPRYLAALNKFGIGDESFEITAQRIASNTGGIGASALLTSTADVSASPCWSLRISLRMLDDKAPAALHLLRELLTNINPRDKARLRDVLTQTRAHYETSLVNNGSATAAHHAGRGLSLTGHLSELMLGLPQLTLAKQYTDHFDTSADHVIQGIEQVRDALLNRARLTASFTGSDSVYAHLRMFLNDWSGSLPTQTIGQTKVTYEPFSKPPREGLAGPMQVAYCVMQMPAPHASHPDEPLLAVGCRLVNMDHVLTKVRFKGNAYGAWFRHEPLASTLEFGSYRDPNITQTLGVYLQAPQYIAQADWSQTDIDRTIIGTAKSDERPIRPGEATGLSLSRHLLGITPAVREKRFDQLKAATPVNIKRALLTALEKGLPSAAVCVVSSREKLQAANEQLGDAALSISDIR